MIVRYGEGDDPNSNIRLPCGGILDVLVENLAPDCDVQAHLRELESALLGQRRLLREVELGSGARSLRDDSSHGPRAERDGECVRLRVGAAQRLLLAGYSSVAHACAEFGKGLGFEVILCDPREEALRGVVLEGIEIRRELPSLFIADGGCHADTAVVALTHDPKIDDLAMLEAVRTEAFYIGVGSRATSEAASSACGASAAGRCRTGADPRADRPQPRQQDAGGNRPGGAGGHSSHPQRHSPRAALMVAADEVLCLVLAAGQGRRFGSDKRLARLADGTTLLAASVARAREAFAEVRVVVRAGDTPASLGLPAQQRLVHSLDASLGMGHSLAAGVAAARNSTARAIAVLLGDMPWIAADTLERLAAMATPEAIVFPLYDGQRGHPVLFGRAFWDALAQLDGDQGARRVLQAHRPAWCEVPCDDPGVLRDVDTPAALG